MNLMQVSSMVVGAHVQYITSRVTRDVYLLCGFRSVCTRDSFRVCAHVTTPYRMATCVCTSERYRILRTSIHTFIHTFQSNHHHHPLRESISSFTPPPSPCPARLLFPSSHPPPKKKKQAYLQGSQRADTKEALARCIATKQKKLKKTLVKWQE